MGNLTKDSEEEKAAAGDDLALVSKFPGNCKVCAEGSRGTQRIHSSSIEKCFTVKKGESTFSTLF